MSVNFAEMKDAPENSRTADIYLSAFYKFLLSTLLKIECSQALVIFFLACIATYPQKRKPLTSAAEKVLVPYACTVLRMTEMPLVNSED